MKARNDFGIERLASRIHELRQNGFDIRSTRVSVYNRFGEKCIVAKYILDK